MSASPINPHLSMQARKLLDYISRLSGKRILTGQHDYLEAPDTYVNVIRSLTGKYPAVHGYEMGPIMNQNEATIAAQRGRVVDSAIAWSNAGGIVTMMYHAHYPGSAPTWGNVQRPTSQSEFNQIVTPGTFLYNSLIQDIDKVAVFLKRLQNASVPVLWRPYHEMNGGWFWWGKKSNFAALWNIMFDRYTSYHNLNNLIWVWNPNAPNAYADPYDRTFPGTNRVDILAADIYNNDYKQSHHDQLLLLASGKPIAIGENGELPNLSTLQASQPRWTWFMTWGKMLRENNSDATIRFVYQNAYTLTRDEVDLEAFPDTTPPPTDPNPDPDPTPEPPNLVGDGLLGHYYSDRNLQQLKLTRTDSTINFDWKRGSPHTSIPVDLFSARWTGSVVPQYSETYTFYTSSDDGVRLWIDGKLIIDRWVDQPRTEWSGTMALIAGKLYSIRLEYYENLGDASISLMWSSPRQPKQLIPQARLFTRNSDGSGSESPSTIPGNGLQGQYYMDKNLTRAAFIRIDATINFDWKRSSPHSSMPIDQFSVRWTGSIVPLYTETYTFYVASDDGALLWVDNKLVVNQWVDQPITERNGTITLVAGQRYPIRLDFYENAGDAAIRLSWSSPRQPKQVIPKSQLYST